MVNNKLSIGELMRRRRLDLDLNQHGLAKKLGVNQSTIAKWERGAKPNPERLPDIADALDVTFDEALAAYYGRAPGTSESVDERFDELVAKVDDLAKIVTEIAQRLESAPQRQPGTRPLRRK